MNKNTVMLQRLCRSVSLLDAVRKSGSFTAAAEQLGLQQSAVSHRVKALEDALGMRLFERTTRRLRPTAAGELVCAAAADTLAAWTRALDALAARRSSNTLRISLSSSLAMKWLLPILPRARQAGLELSVDVDDDIADLAGGDADVALRFGRGPYPGLHSVHLAHCDLQPVASPAYLTGLSRLDEFLRHPDATLLADRRGAADSTGFSWGDYLNGAEVEFPEASRGLAFDRADLMLQAAVGGNGVALGRTLLIEADIAAGFLRRVGPALRMRAAYWLVCAPSLAATDGFARATRWLKAEARETVALGRRSAPHPPGADPPLAQR